MKLRPHHLLCTQSYAGRGYNTHFVANMDKIVHRLRNERGLMIDLVFSTDDICAACPRMLGPGRCLDDAKVRRIDQKMVALFGLAEKSYCYDTIIAEIRALMTAARLEDICGNCNWYPVSGCQACILGE